VVSVTVLICWLAATVAVTVHGRGAAGLIAPAWIVFGLYLTYTWRWVFVPYVALTPEAAVVQNGVTHRTIPYSRIAVVRQGYFGLQLETKDYDIVTAWAVQKPQVSKWAQTHTRADEVAEAIKARMTASF
jgi:hypothetical protein